MASSALCEGRYLSEMEVLACESASQHAEAVSTANTDEYAGHMKVKVIKARPKAPAQRAFMGAMIPEEPLPPANDDKSLMLHPTDDLLHLHRYTTVSYGRDCRHLINSMGCSSATSIYNAQPRLA